MTTTVSGLLTGLGLGLSLIIAIGAQNAFVLRQGITRHHVTPVVAICAASDAVLIIAGVAGIGFIIDRAPEYLTAVRYAGAAFLLAYAALAVRRAVRASALTTATGPAPTALGGTVLTCLALTWLNPHVYLDTVVTLGSIANGHGDPGRWLIAAGAATASLAWFTALGYGSRLLRPLFAKPVSWRVLDTAIAVVMTAIAVGLVTGT